MPVRCNCKEAAKRLLELGLSYSEVARVLGVSEKTVKRWTGGALQARPKPAEARAVEPTVETAARAEAGVPIVQNEWVRLLRSRGLYK
ncbi:MAG: helix-turn-helix domain-containing protein [Pyrobaculum sp.]